MRVLVLGRRPDKIEVVLATLGAAGFDGVGVTTDEEAITLVGAGGLGGLVIGGGVGSQARAALKDLAAQHHTAVVESNLANRESAESIREYVRAHIIPKLRAAAPPLAG